MRWSLRIKILAVFSALLVSVVFAYLILAGRIFREDKELLVFDTNRSSTEQFAYSLETFLTRSTDRLELLVQLVANPRRDQALNHLFERDHDLLAFQLIDPEDPGKPIREMVSDAKLAAVGLTAADLKEQRVMALPPGGPASGVTIENRSIKRSVLYLLRVPVKSGEGQGKSYFAEALLDGRFWIETFRQGQGLSLTFAVTSDGVIFAHPQAELVLQRKSFAGLELLKLARRQAFAVQQSEFEFEGKRYLGVYRKTSDGGLVVLSMTDKNAALAASKLLLEKTIVLSLIIVTTVFLVCLFFASSLSRPLLRLVRATREIARGNFDTPVDIRTRDEIGALAQAFSRMSHDLKSSRELLEHKVQERTRELERKNADIRRQQEILVRTARLAAVGEIAGQAAHEVLNPLTAMTSRLEALSMRLKVLEETPDTAVPVMKEIVAGWKADFEKDGVQGWLAALGKPSDVHHGKTLAEEDMSNLSSIARELEGFIVAMRGDIDLLLRESHRIGRIVNGMRSLSRASSSRTRVDITALISDCIRLNEELLESRKIAVRTSFRRSPVHVSADSDEMRQVFSNLLKNSMDAIEARRMGSGNGDGNASHEGLITIGVETTDEKVMIRVWDNGLGIPSANLQRIFETNFTTKGTGGTGLGLSISRRMVRAAGGDLTISATEHGKFAEFELTLPILPDNDGGIASDGPATTV